MTPKLHTRRGMLKAKKILAVVALHLVLIIISSFGVFPFLWSLSSSLKSNKELYTMGFSFIPRQPTLENYLYVIRGIKGIGGAKGSQILLLYRNTFVVTFASVLLSVLFNTLAGYAFARLRFKGRDAIFYFFILLGFVPAGGTLMALYELMKLFHLLDSLLGLIILYTGAGGVSLLLMRQIFLGIPSDLEDAARIDGASSLRIAFSIMIPLATSGMVMIGIMQFISLWGEYLMARTFIFSWEKMTLAYGISKIVVFVAGQDVSVGVTSGYGIVSTSTMLLAVPAVLVFIFLQRWFIRGAVEGLKI